MYGLQLAESRTPETEEAWAGPARAGDLPGDGSERAVPFTPVLEPALEDDHLVDFTMPCARKPGAGLQGHSLGLGTFAFS